MKARRRDVSNKLPFFQFFPLDWLADTTILSNEAKGAYIDILCQLWLSDTPGQRTWYKKEFTNMLRLFEHEHDVEGPIYEIASVCEVHFRDSDDNMSDFETCATITVISRRMTRDWLKLSKLKSKHKKYNDQRTTKQRPDNDRKTTDRSQKLEVRSQKLEEEYIPPKSPLQGDQPVLSLVKILSPAQFGEDWNNYYDGKLPRIELPLSEDRKRKLKSRLSRHSQDEYWQVVFDHIAESDFLMGRLGKWNATFDWLIANDTNPQKVFEGNYANKQKEQRARR